MQEIKRPKTPEELKNALTALKKGCDEYFLRFNLVFNESFVQGALYDNPQDPPSPEVLWLRKKNKLKEMLLKVIKEIDQLP